jgi:hypothetical protein
MKEGQQVLSNAMWTIPSSNEARSALVVIGCRTETASPKEDYAFSSCLPILNFNGQTTQFTIRSQTAVYNHSGLLFSRRHPQNTTKQETATIDMNRPGRTSNAYFVSPLCPAANKPTTEDESALCRILSHMFHLEALVQTLLVVRHKDGLGGRLRDQQSVCNEARTGLLGHTRATARTC